MKISEFLARQICLFLGQLATEQFTDVSELAAVLEDLAHIAWLEAFEFTPPSLRID